MAIEIDAHMGSDQSHLVGLSARYHPDLGRGSNWSGAAVLAETGGKGGYPPYASTEG
jgi:hypothetical protein